MTTERIDFISAYCDRWCERCAFQERCSVFASHAAIAMCGDAEQGMELAFGGLGEGPGTVGQLLPKECVNAEVSERELVEFQRQEDLRRARLEQLPLHSMAHGMLRWIEWLKGHREAIARRADFVVTEALAIVCWDASLIYVKLHRALDGRDRFQTGEEDCDEERIQNDWNGSAKVALISIERSIAAWHTIAAAAGDAGAMSFASEAETLHKIVLDEFPNAPSFVRPGFDDGRISPEKRL